MTEKIALLTVREIEEKRSVQGDARSCDSWTYRPLAALKANPLEGMDDPLAAIHYLEGMPIARMHIIREEGVLNETGCPWIWVGSLQVTGAR